MKLLVLGANGMLGHELLGSWKDNHDVLVTLRKKSGESKRFETLFNNAKIIYDVDANSLEKIERVIEEFTPDAIINCIGIIKQRDEANSFIPSIEVNAAFPHKLNDICHKMNVRLVQISTDCVFSGEKGNYKEEDFADANDLYGRTKYLGELNTTNSITIRSSIIGLELEYCKSLIEWFLAQKGVIKGFDKAIYTGLTTMEMARVIERILLQHKEINGVYHVASAPISKYKLLIELGRLLKRDDLKIEKDNMFLCDRSLNSSRFNDATGYQTPTWDKMLNELAGRIESRSALK